MTRMRGPMGERERSGKSKRARHVPGAPMTRLLVWGLRQAGLDSLHIEEIVILAPHHLTCVQPNPPQWLHCRIDCPGVLLPDSEKEIELSRTQLFAFTACRSSPL
jgi:hypothetical protein